MKKLSFLISCLTCFAFLSAQATDLPQLSDVSSNVPQELDTLDAIIEVTQENLQQQERLREEVRKYQALQARYLKNPDSGDLLFQMVRSAYKISEIINSAHLQHAFSKTFLNEIEMFARVATKRGIPKP